MITFDFEQYWNSHFSKCPPVGYLLRHNYPELWFRFHTLPESKRYPETENEYKEILFRHNTFLFDLFDNREIYVLVTSYSHTKRRSKPKYVDKKALQLSYVMCIPMHVIDGDDYERYWYIWMTMVDWKVGMADYYLRQVADDKIANMIFVDPKKNLLYHPYDGGTDIIVSYPGQISALKEKYKAWLPTNPEGL